LTILVGTGALADEHQVGVGIAHAKDDLPSTEPVELASAAVGADLDAEDVQRVRLGCEHTNRNGWFNGFGRFRGFRRLEFEGCNRFWLRRPWFGGVALDASAPLGVPAEPVDTELLKELEMGAPLLAGHD
jgi:hypothetical protein